MIRPKDHIAALFRIGAPDKERAAYLRLDMNESPLGLPDGFIQKALVKADAGYLSMYPDYRQITRMIAQHDGLGPENICLANGSDAAIKYLFEAYISPGDKVLLTDPTFAMYPVYVQMFRAEAVVVEYLESLEFPFDAFMRQLVPGIRMAVLINPNNPTGSVISSVQLLKIIRKARRANILLIVDEAYHYFYPETIMQAIKSYDNLVVLRTFSKLCAMASLRLGYAAASPDIIKNLKKVQPTFDVNGLAVLLAEKLLAHPQVMSRAIASVVRGKEYLVKKLSAAGVDHKEGKANFILIKCAGRVDQVVRGLEADGILVHGGFRQRCLKDYIRVTLADPDTMAYFWKRFAKI